MILTGLTACDNVSWGGVELRLEAPPAAETGAAEADTAAVEEETPPPLDLEPVLYTVERNDDSVRVTPVAVLGPSGLRSFPSEAEIPDVVARFREERMGPGRRFVLYSGGRRVGSLYTGSSQAVDTTFCVPRPAVTGRVELVPSAVEVERFLAVPADSGDARPPDDFQRMTSTRAQRVASLNMAAALFSTMQIQWPPSIVEARADIRIFRPRGAETELIAATFLYGDSLTTGPAPPNAYSLFFLGEQIEGDFDPTYVRYREVGVDGKAAARFVDHMDWDDDGSDEILLQVYGVESRWFAALQRDEAGEWRETFREGCAETGESDMALFRRSPAGRPERAQDPAP